MIVPKIYLAQLRYFPSNLNLAKKKVNIKLFDEKRSFILDRIKKDFKLI
jgi:hypothetical protein